MVASVKEEITLDRLSNKVVAVDAYNTIYQFLSIIRGPDGMPLRDQNGMTTSHLSGLFYRTINLMEHRITPIFVFDGMPPALKQRTLAARAQRRETAMREWSEALKKGMMEEARQHAMASTRINKEIVGSSKELLDLMGIAHIQAPSEGEAEAARLAADGMVYASASQDYDLFLFGSPLSVRNLTITGRRKLPRKNVFVDIHPELVELKRLLASLGITQRQLVWLGMLVGTDFNEGVPGVGAKTALKIVREKRSLQEVVSSVESKYNAAFEADPEEVEALFLNPEIREVERGEFNTMLKEAKPDKEALLGFMCNEHGFSRERIGRFADMLAAMRSSAGQKNMGSWV